MTPTPHDGATPTPRPDGDPVEAFRALVRATKAHDYRGATQARKLLRTFGWACAPCGKGVAG